jgi:hypothetical protein
MHREASRILAAIDGRIAGSTKSGANIEVTYGQVYQVSGRECSAYLVGSKELALSEGTVPEPSVGFRIPSHLSVAASDYVRVSMDDRGDRWVDEVFNPQGLSTGSGTDPLTYAQAVALDSPRIHLRLGEESGTVLDQTGSHNGSVSGTVTRNVVGPLLPAQDDGAIGTYGTGFVSVPSHTNLNFPGSISIEAWIKLTTVPSIFGATIVGKGSGSYQFLVRQDGKLELAHSDVISIMTSVEPVIQSDTWYHVVATYLNPGGFHMYVNKQEIPVENTNDTIIGSNTEPLGIGSKYGSTLTDPFTGELDEVAIYSTILPPAKIADHYDAGVAVPEVFQERFRVTQDGALEWSGLSVERDTNLYRPDANLLKTDDSMIVGGTMQWGALNDVHKRWRYIPMAAYDHFVGAASAGAGPTTIELIGIPPQSAVAVSGFMGIRRADTADANFKIMSLSNEGVYAAYTSGVASRGGFSNFGPLAVGGTGQRQIKYASTNATSDLLYLTITGYWTLEDLAVIPVPITTTRFGSFAASAVLVVGEPIWGPWSATWSGIVGTNIVTADAVLKKAASATVTADAVLASAGGGGGTITHAQDTFTRTSVDSWGTANVGGAWVVKEGVTSEFDVDGSAGTIINGGVWQGKQIALDSVVERDIDYTLRVKANKIATGTGAYTAIWVQARRVNDANMYLYRLQWMADNTIQVGINRVVNGTSTAVVAMGTISGTPATDTYWKIRVQAFGASPTTVRMRAWRDTDVEPNTWQASATDSGSTLQVAGSVGINAFNSPGITNNPILYTVDDVLVTNITGSGTVFGGFTADSILKKLASGTFTADSVLTSGLTTYVQDTFTRSLSDQWGTASPTGGAWTVTEAAATNFAVNGSFGTIISAANLAGRQISQDSINVGDVDLHATVKIDKVPTGTGAFSQIYLQGRRADNNNRYSGRLRFNTGGGMSVSIDRAVTGTFTTIAGPTTISGTMVAGDLWHVRVQIVGASPTTIRMRAWKDGDAEPGTWQESITDSSAGLQGSGKVAVAWITSAMTNLPTTLSVDEFIARSV